MFRPLKYLLGKFKKQNLSFERDLILVLDIGTDTIKALVCKRDNREMMILGSGSYRQTLKDMYQGNITDIEGVAENCQEAIKNAEYEAGVSPSHMILGLSGELVKSVVSHIDYTRENEEKNIGPDEMQYIVEKVQWQALVNIRQEISESTVGEEIDIKLIHSAITKVTIDGYDISNPVGFTGKNLHITVFNVFAPLLQYNSLEAITQRLGKKLVFIASESYAISKSLGCNDASDISALFIDIGAGTTEIAMVHDGSIQTTVLYGQGGRSFTKQIMRAMDVSYMEAEKLKIGEEKSTASKKEKLEKIMRKALESWIEGLKISLEQCQKSAPLPSKIFLCGGGSQLAMIRDELQGSDWYKQFSFATRPRISIMHPKDIASVIDLTKTLKSPQDVAVMSIANLFLELQIFETPVAKMLRKASRLVER